MASRADIVAEARKWLGTKFRHQGRSERGLDCGGLIIKVAHGLGISSFDITHYRPNADGAELVKHFRANMDEIHNPALAQPGDALIFTDAVYPCHCAILSEKHGVKHLVHAYAPAGRVCEDPFAFDWPRKLRFAFAYRGLEG